IHACISLSTPPGTHYFIAGKESRRSCTRAGLSRNTYSRSDRRLARSLYLAAAALLSFEHRCHAAVPAWTAGREVENTRIGDPSLHKELGALLESRAKLLLEWAEDDSL